MEAIQWTQLEKGTENTCLHWLNTSQPLAWFWAETYHLSWSQLKCRNAWKNHFLVTWFFQALTTSNNKYPTQTYRLSSPAPLSPIMAKPGYLEKFRRRQAYSWQFLSLAVYSSRTCLFLYSWDRFPVPWGHSFYRDKYLPANYKD